MSSKDSYMNCRVPNEKKDEAERIIMSRSWWNPIEWQTPLAMMGAGALLLLIYAVQSMSVRPLFLLMIGALVLERFAWAAVRAWWRHKHREKSQLR